MSEIKQWVTKLFKQRMLFIVILGLIVQLCVSPFSAHIYDTKVWFETGEFIVNGAYLDTDNPVYNIYTFAKREFEAGNYPEGAYVYTPFWAYICAFSYLLFKFLLQGGFTIGGYDYYLKLFIFKIPIIFSNMLIPIVLLKIARLHSLDNRLTSLLIIGYLFNPYVIEVSSIWGMFDCISVLFTLLSYYLFQRGKVEYSLLSLGMGIAVKLYPLLLVPIFFLKMKWRGLRTLVTNLILTFTPTFLICLPFVIWDFKSFISVMALTGLSTSCNNFSWWSGVWRLLNIYVTTPTDPLSYENPLLSIMVIANTVIAVSSLLLSYYFVKKKDLSLLSGIVLTFLSLYITHRYIQETQALWIIPFVLIDLYINREKMGAWWLLPLIILGGTHSIFGNPVFVLWGDWFRRIMPFSKILYQNIDWVVRYVYTFFSGLYILQILRRRGLKINLSSLKKCTR